MKNLTKKIFAISMFITFGTSLLTAQVFADQITVTATGTDGHTTCCGASPLTNGLSSSKRITSRALGIPQASDVSTSTASYNFYSLGFGGEVVVRMGNGFNNIAGTDLQIHETSFGVTTACSGSNPDRVRVWVSQDNCNYILIGDFCEQGPNPILVSLPSYLPWARFVKLRDITVNPNTSASATQDGFDLDGLRGISGRTSAPTAGSSIYANTIYSFLQGLTASNLPVSPASSNSAQALGAPQNSDAGSINFVSLGFGGSITLEMERLVFKRSTGNEIQIVETSTGSPSCASSPERAQIYGSLNGTTWVLLGDVCNDGLVSIPTSASLLASSGQYAIRYIRVNDISNQTSFTGTANGYDLDGVTGFACATSAKLAEFSEELNPEQTESEDIVIFPNPTNGIFTVKINPINENGIIRIFNISGALIKEYSQLGNDENVKVSIEEFPAGLYLVSYQDGERQFIKRIVKN
jgi:hypothetical protein